MMEKLFLDFFAIFRQKTCTVKPRSNPFDEYDNDEYKMRFRPIFNQPSGATGSRRRRGTAVQAAG